MGGEFREGRVLSFVHCSDCMWLLAISISGKTWSSNIFLLNLSSSWREVGEVGLLEDVLLPLGRDEDVPGLSSSFLFPYSQILKIARSRWHLTCCEFVTVLSLGI